MQVNNGRAARWAEFGEKLAEWRHRQEISQRELACKLGYSRGRISQFEAGLEAPSSRFIVLLTDRLDMSSVAKRKWHRLGAKAAGWEIE